MKRVFYITTQYHGSNKQLESLANEMGDAYQVFSCAVSLRSRSVALRPFYIIIYKLCQLLRVNLGVFKKMFLHGFLECPKDDDIIIAKTAPCEFPAILMKAGSRAKLIFIGEPKRIKREMVDILISTPSTLADDPDIFLETLPVRYVSPHFTEAKNKLNISSVGLMLGGNANGYSYSEKDWISIAELARSFYEMGCEVYILTSPRTTKSAEQAIKQSLREIDNGKARIKFSFWSEGDVLSVEHVLKEIDFAIVTEDSASMLSEVISSKIPAAAVYPKGCSYNSLVTPLSAYHSKRGSIMRVDIDNMSCPAMYAWLSESFRPVERAWAEEWSGFWS